MEKKEEQQHLPHRLSHDDGSTRETDMIERKTASQRWGENSGKETAAALSSTSSTWYSRTSWRNAAGRVRPGSDASHHHYDRGHVYVQS